jgi:drug/metabolite transporter (DMT)-like permease
MSAAIPDPAQVIPEVLEAERHEPTVTWPGLYALVGAMVLIWACNFIIGKVAVQEFSASLLGGLRIQVAAVMLLVIFALARGVRGLSGLRGNWKLMSVLGLFGVAGNQGFFVLGLKHTSVAHSSLIISVGPVFVLILACLHRLEKLTPLKVGGIALSMAGVAILAGEHHNGQGASLLGDIFTAVGSLAFAYFVILSKEVRPRFDSLSLNTFVFLTGAIIMLPFTAGGLWTGGFEYVTWRGWLAMLYMAAFSSVAGYLIFYYGLKYIAATRMSAFSYLQPPIATALSWLLLGEPITLPLVAGGLVIFAGVYITEKG